jgi:hypothetical protein
MIEVRELELAGGTEALVARIHEVLRDPTRFPRAKHADCRVGRISRSVHERADDVASTLV